MGKPTTEPIYRTHDVSEGAALALYLKAPSRIEEDAQGRVIFAFESKKAQELSAKYWSGQLKGDLREFALCLRGLKDVIFARRRGQHISVGGGCNG